MRISGGSGMLLEMTNIHAGYGKIQILRGASLKVNAGQVVSIIGPNGAGKSTMFKTLFGLLRVTEGKVSFEGNDVTNRSPADLLRAGMAFVPQGRNVFPLMTVDENIRLGGYTRKAGPELEANIAYVYEIFPMLNDLRKRRAADLSGGQQQMLEMGRALMLRPKLLLLDEPTLGLAPIVFKEIFRMIEALRERGQTILMVEQNASQALAISDYAYVLELGRNKFEGTGADIQNDSRIRKLYLGR
jgi:branched-chain amino acid transport system ATP-binding protein